MKVGPPLSHATLPITPQGAVRCSCLRIAGALLHPWKALSALFSWVMPHFKWSAADLYKPSPALAEYEDLVKEDLPLDQVDFSVGRANLYKNRYSDVFPNENTRVKSPSNPFFYYNANWVLGGTVIACQGPRVDDLHVFWNMVLENEVETIVMLTDLQEKQFEKCAKYWNLGSVGHLMNGLPVNTKSEMVVYTNGSEEIVKREIQIGKKGKVVTQYHLQNFPDHGIVKPETLAYLVQITAKSEGKILAHCSAGIGRTGTYCAALGAYRQNSWDVRSVVKSLRHPETGRCLMVQTAPQYKLACDAVKLIVTSLPSRVWSSVWRSNRA